MAAEEAPTVGVVLAGGLARRLGGGDKALRQIGGQSLLSRIIGRLSPQCDGILVNANGDLRRFETFGLPVVADSLGDFPGPLAGILAGLDWLAENRAEVEWLVSTGGDVPFLPRDLVERLQDARRREDAMVAVAQSGGRLHPVIGLWNVALRADLRRALVDEGMRRVDSWIARHRHAVVTWPVRPVDPFFNVNVPEDLAEAKRLAAILDA